MDGEKKRFWMEKSPSTDESNWINLVAMDGEKKRLLLDGEIAEADLMRFGWIDTEARPYEKATWKSFERNKKVIGIDMDADWMRFGLV